MEPRKPLVAALVSRSLAMSLKWAPISREPGERMPRGLEKMLVGLGRRRGDEVLLIGPEA